MISVWLLGGYSGVLLTSFSVVDDSSGVGSSSFPTLLVDWTLLRDAVFLVKVGSYCRFSDLINMSSPYCTGFDFDFAGQRSRLGRGDSANLLFSGLVASGNDCLAYIQLEGRAVT